MFKKRQGILQDLEDFLDLTLLASLKEEAEQADSSQFRPCVIKFPGCLKILKQIQAENLSDLSDRTDSSQIRFSRLMSSIAINMGLDL